MERENLRGGYRAGLCVLTITSRIPRWRYHIPYNPVYNSNNWLFITATSSCRAKSGLEGSRGGNGKQGEWGSYDCTRIVVNVDNELEKEGREGFGVAGFIARQGRWNTDE